MLPAQAVPVAATEATAAVPPTLGFTPAAVAQPIYTSHTSHTSTPVWRDDLDPSVLVNLVAVQVVEGLDLSADWVDALAAKHDDLIDFLCATCSAARKSAAALAQAGRAPGPATGAAT